MKRGVVILKNSIRCKNCGDVLVSRSRHDWVCCSCFRESNGTRGVFNDGGLDYMRRGGNPDDYEDLSETRPFTDEEVDDYNKVKHEIYEQYGWTVDEMEK